MPSTERSCCHCTIDGTIGAPVEMIKDTETIRIYLCPTCKRKEVITKESGYTWWYQRFLPDGSPIDLKPISDMPMHTLIYPR